MKERVFKKMKKDSGGFSLVELVCAVAILSVISTVIGGILVVSSNNYKRGNDETVLQQEVQFTVNKISGLLMDAADTAEYGFYNGGTRVAAENEAAALGAGAGSGSNRYLKVVTATTTYIIRFDAATNTLLYSENGSAEALLAENIITFEADTTTFVKNRNVVIKLGVAKEGRSITSDYNITARNGVPASLVSAVTASANINVGTDLILEPKQTCTIPVSVTGEGISDYGFELVSVSDQHADTAISVDAAGITITPGAAETGGSDQAIILHLKTKARAEDGVTALDTASVSVKIRRVNTIGVNSTPVSGTPATSASTAFETGARYKIDGVISGQNLEQAVGFYYDLDYKNPKYVQWGFSYTDASGAVYSESSTEFQNRFKLVSEIEDHSAPYVVVELKQQMPGGSKLTVTGTSKHAKGTVGGTVYNKTGNLYANVSGSVTLTSTAVADTASISTESEIVLEPNQPYTIPVSVTGAGISDYGFNLAVSDQASGTAITATDTSISVVPGAAEKGGSDGKIVLTLTTKATKEDGVTPLDTKTIDVKIRRVNSMEVGAIAVSGTPAIVNGTEFEPGARYKFNAAVAGQNLSQVEGADYDTDYKSPNYAAFSLSYTDEEGNVYSDSDSEFESMFKITARDENIDAPYVIVELLQQMPKDSKLTATATSKHASGAYNKTGSFYATVKDSFTLVSDAAEETDQDEFLELKTPDVGINRGAEIFFNNKLMEEYGTDEGLRNVYAPEDGNAQSRWVMRIREKNENGSVGEWGEFIWMNQRSILDMKMNSSESKLMLPDKAYEFQICGFVCNEISKVVYWPYNAEFVSALDGFTKGYTSDEEIPYEDFSSIFEVGKVGLSFRENETYGVKAGDRNVGSEEAPIMTTVFNKWANWPDIFSIVIKGDINGLEVAQFQNSIKAYVQIKTDDGGWETLVNANNYMIAECTLTSYPGTDMSLEISVIQEAARGKDFRIGFSMENITHPDWESSYDLLSDDESGEGFIYLRVE